MKPSYVTKKKLKLAIQTTISLACHLRCVKEQKLAHELEKWTVPAETCRENNQISPYTWLNPVGQSPMHNAK